MLVLFLTSTVVFAQSADVITKILESEKVSFGQISYLSACHQKMVSDDVSLEEAFEALQKSGQVSPLVSAADFPSYDAVAAVYAKMWNIKGGLFYRMTKGSARYAFKQLKADGVIPSSADPKSKVSGSQVLNLYTKCNLVYGNINLDVSE